MIRWEEIFAYIILINGWLKINTAEYLFRHLAKKRNSKKGRGIGGEGGRLYITEIQAIHKKFKAEDNTTSMYVGSTQSHVSSARKYQSVKHLFPTLWSTMQNSFLLIGNKQSCKLSLTYIYHTHTHTLYKYS